MNRLSPAHTPVKTVHGIKLIACDLDGTLLDSRKSIPPSTLQTIRQVRSQGLLFGIATARSGVSARPVTSLVEPDFCVLNGGALVTAGSRTLYQSLLPAATVLELTTCCAGSGRVDKITAETPDGYWADYCNPAPEYAHAFIHDFHMPFAKEAYKITIESGDEGFIHELSVRFPDVDVLRFHGENWYRFARRGAGKWQGLQAVLAHLGLEPSQVCAFGDDYNDLEMLREAGWGIAMANAAAEVKSAAGYQTAGNDEEGVAKFIQSFLLDRRKDGPVSAGSSANGPGAPKFPAKPAKPF